MGLTGRILSENSSEPKRWKLESFRSSGEIFPSPKLVLARIIVEF